MIPYRHPHVPRKRGPRPVHVDTRAPAASAFAKPVVAPLSGNNVQSRTLDVFMADGSRPTLTFDVCPRTRMIRGWRIEPSNPIEGSVG